jgi:hypothetical protein
MSINRVHFGFFGRVLALGNAMRSESHPELGLSATARNARTPPL